MKKPALTPRKPTGARRRPPTTTDRIYAYQVQLQTTLDALRRDLPFFTDATATSPASQAFCHAAIGDLHHAISHLDSARKFICSR